MLRVLSTPAWVAFQYTFRLLFKCKHLTTNAVLSTHYKSESFPVEWQRICRPNGLRYGYFDATSSTWPGRHRSGPTFAWQCALEVPKLSSFAPLVRSLAGKEPTSYETIASQASCPPEVNVHEYLAFQSMLGGTNRRWMSILRELGSSNVNFSTEATMCLISHLALQCGPASPSRDPLRTVHMIFHDEAFCDKLFEQLSLKLDALETNWREVYLMDIVITLSYRMYSFEPSTTSGKPTSRAYSLLGRARRITYRWMNLLQKELQRASNSEMTKRTQLYALWAALLCKRTFAAYLDQTRSLSTSLDGDLLRLFIECCIIVHQSLADNADALPWTLKNSAVRDFKMMHRMRNFVKRSIIYHIHSLVRTFQFVCTASHYARR